jgi:hypothetical protein
MARAAVLAATTSTTRRRRYYGSRAGYVRWTGLCRRRAGTQHDSHANSVLGSCCIALYCTKSSIGSGVRTQVAAGSFSYLSKV